MDSEEPDLKAAVMREMREAMANDCPIIVVVVGMPESTHADLMAVVSGYHKLVTVTKYSASGAQQIVFACEYHGFTMKRFRAVGVYADLCVHKTTVGLVELVPDCAVEIVEDACRPTADSGFWGPYSMYKNLYEVIPNVVLLPGSSEHCPWRDAERAR